MDEILAILHGCKLAKELETSLQNMAGQKSLLLSSCEQIVVTFSKAISNLNPQHPFAYYVQILNQLPETQHGPTYRVEDLLGSSFRQQPMELLPVRGTPEEANRGERSISPVAINEGSDSGRRSRKRKESKEKVIQRVPASWNSEVPPDDGHVWRKYGQKEILGSRFPKSYYRCTHGKLGCEAKKQVQRTDDDYFMFQVTYTGSHKCQTMFKALPSPSVEIKQEALLPSATLALLSTSIQLNSMFLEGFAASGQQGQTSILDPFQIPLRFNTSGESSGTAVVKEMDSSVMELADVMFNCPNTSNSMDAIFTSKSWDLFEKENIA